MEVENSGGDGGDPAALSSGVVVENCQHPHQVGGGGDGDRAPPSSSTSSSAPPPKTTAATASTTSSGAVFACGVVEGFYNRPWSQGQRVDLYKKLGSFGLNVYLYAPKDDVKHRALWRELYSEPELRQLRALVDGSRENGVTFYYGISPGLDMAYSSDDDMRRLKAKLDQLVGLGCCGFAILWDDIDTQMSPADRKMFNSLADAHVKVTNEVFHHLKCPPAFLTCPVEYCATRAEPNVASSHYLNTFGVGLHPAIGVFWTGSRVVSEVITKAEILALTEVLRRKPVIWDNIHANDYDQARVFLGPYSGRSPDLIPHLAGVFTNPNCEYSLNIPALFTLAAWSHCYDPRTGNVSSWNPLMASELAVPHFLEECHRPTQAFSHQLQQQQDQQDPQQQQQQGPSSSSSIKLCSSGGELGKEDIELLFHFYWLPHSNGPKAAALVEGFRKLRDHAHIIQRLGLYRSSPAPTPSASAAGGAVVGGNGEDDRMSADNNEEDEDAVAAGHCCNFVIDVDEIYNSAGTAASSLCGSGVSCESLGEKHIISCWLRRASYFNEVCKRFGRLIDKLTFIENREMFFDLNGYLSNVNVILQACNRFLKWVGIESCHKPISGGPTLAGLPGGVAGDLLRLYPVKSNSDYPLCSAEGKSADGLATLVCRPLSRSKNWSSLGPAFFQLICEGQGVSEGDIPEDVAKVIQNFKVGVFLNEEDAKPLIIEECSGGGSDGRITACLVGSRSVGNLIKSLQHVLDTAKSLDSGHLPLALPNDELPLYSLSSYDVLATFCSTSRLLFTAVLENAFKTFFETFMSKPTEQVPCKFGMIMERAATVSIQFLTEQNFRKVGTYGHYVILELELTAPV